MSNSGSIKGQTKHYKLNPRYAQFKPKYNSLGPKDKNVPESFVSRLKTAYEI